MLSSAAFVHFNRKADAILATIFFVYEPRLRLRRASKTLRQRWRSKRTEMIGALDAAGSHVAFALIDFQFRVAGHRDESHAIRKNPNLYPAVAA